MQDFFMLDEQLAYGEVSQNTFEARPHN